jgi:hypothetical protein
MNMMLTTKDDGRQMMPALALRGVTVFPNMLIHFDVASPSFW